MTKPAPKATPASKREPTDLRTAITNAARQAKRYSVAGFIVFIAALYGFLLYQTNNLSNAQPSEDAVSSQVKAAKLPHIDQTTVNQLQSLQDNSVNVQTLFNQARNNPF